MILTKGLSTLRSQGGGKGDTKYVSLSHLQVCERLALGVNCLPGVLQCLILEGEEGGGGEET